MEKQLVLVGLEGPRAQNDPKDLLVSHFGNAAQALEVLANQPAAAVLSAWQLPDCSGRRFLDEVQMRFPKAHRLLAVDWERADNNPGAGGGPHFLVPHDLNGREIQAALCRIDQIRDWLGPEAPRPFSDPCLRLPAPPQIYFRYEASLRSKDVTWRQLESLIRRDLQLEARWMELANDPAMGLVRPAALPGDVFEALGIECAGALLLLAQVLTPFSLVSPQALRLREFRHHALVSGRLARAIAQSERMPDAEANQAFAAGLLHDLGKLLLAVNMPEAYAKVQAEADFSRHPAWQAEGARLGIAHPEAGAWLGALWGLPASTVAAIAFHHTPTRLANQGFHILDTVHAASILAHELGETAWLSPRAVASLAYLEEKGLSARHLRWWQLANRLYPAGTDGDQMRRVMAA